MDSSSNKPSSCFLISRGQLLLVQLLLLLQTATTGPNLCTSLSTHDCESLSSIRLDGTIKFPSSFSASTDFGKLHYSTPGAILYPLSTRDIALVVAAAYASPSNITVSAKGAGHSVAGQAQVPSSGILLEMSSLRGIQVFPEESPPYVEARGGELWVDVVKESMKFGLSPRSLTDYLYLTVGGTLSNAGVSGQAFRHGPQISNVLQLEVVTGKGEVVNCSPLEHADLFFAVLGGLGQFGIITKARINLEPAPQKVKWIRALYSDFKAFTRDQELLISRPEEESFDYVEGSVIVNSNHPSNERRPIPFHGQVLNASSIPDSAGPVLYCLELTKNYNEHEQAEAIDKKVASLLAPLGHIPSLVFSKDATYFEFLERVHDGEIRLRKKGLWDVPHPWMNLFVPKSRIEEFNEKVFQKILHKGINGPLLVYPLDKSKWDSRTSVVTPNESIFYLVGMLRYATLSGVPSANSLPQHPGEAEWRDHFGLSWNLFMQRKAAYDPQAILAPGQKILTRRRDPIVAK